MKLINPLSVKDMCLIDKIPSICVYSKAVLDKPFDWPENYFQTNYLFLEQNKINEDEIATRNKITNFINKRCKNKPIYIGFGSVHGTDEHALKITVDIVNLIIKLKLRAVIAFGQGGLNEDYLKKFPKIICAIKAVSHDWLFQRVELLVHHGGSLTTGRSFKHNVPSIIFPSFHDQFIWARSLYEKGVIPEPVNFSDINYDTLMGVFRDYCKNIDQYKQKTSEISYEVNKIDGCAKTYRILSKIHKKYVY